MGKKIKNKELAEKLGVSPTLVSLVLNNKADLHGIKKETQEKVLAMAGQMGYFETREKRSTPYPVETAPGIIGMIVPSVNDPLVYGITPYLQKAFASIGTGFTVILRDTDDHRFNRLMTAFRKFFSGLILTGEAADEKTIRTLRDHDYPFVLLEKTTDKYRLNTVVTDVAAGIKLLTEHIGRLGYKNILFMCGSENLKENEKIIRNLTGELNNLSGGIIKHAVEVIDEPMVEGEIDFGKIEKYFKPPLSIQLIVAMNASHVYPLIATLEVRKIRIPQDVALISFEEGQGFDFFHPPVTALRKPLAGLALKASNMIWSEIKNAGKVKYRRSLSLAPELIVRKSCGSY